MAVGLTNPTREENIRLMQERMVVLDEQKREVLRKVRKGVK